MKTNTPNPLVPQGTFSDPKAKSNLRMTVFLIIAGHIVLISGLLMAGCKKTAEPTPSDQGLITSTFDTNTLPPLTNNPEPVVTTSNPVPVEPSNPPAPVVMNNNPVPPPPAPVVNEGEREHTIVAKDSFYTLAKKYSTSMKAIEQANPGIDSKHLKIGQKIKIPAPTAAKTAVAPVASEGGQRIHVVKSNERLLTIAKAEGTTVNAIKAANNLRTDRIVVGQKLKIPAKAAVSPAAPVTESVPMTPVSAPVSAPMTPANP